MVMMLAGPVGGGGGLVTVHGCQRQGRVTCKQGRCALVLKHQSTLDIAWPQPPYVADVRHMCALFLETCAAPRWDSHNHA